MEGMNHYEIGIFNIVKYEKIMMVIFITPICNIF